jgi:chorismate dehydratase
MGLRVGAVAYLNARPLYEGLAERCPDVALRLDHPSRLADDLARGLLDVALIPSVEYLREAGRGYAIVPGIAIAARGPVRSVKLFARRPWREVDRLALDDGSRTSQALARIWLAEVYGVRPTRVEALPVGVSPLESTADAVLAIGDRAMKVPADAFEASVDLGEAWMTWTGRPFVFALWVARGGVELGDLPARLRACKAAGLADAGRIAAEQGRRLGLDPADCLDYLTRALSYDLGTEELAGLRLFACKAEHLGLAPGGVDLVFAEPRRDPAAHR